LRCGTFEISGTPPQAERSTTSRRRALSYSQQRSFCWNAAMPPLADRIGTLWIDFGKIWLPPAHWSFLAMTIGTRHGKGMVEKSMDMPVSSITYPFV
jgi:hypothetical protein